MTEMSLELPQLFLEHVAVIRVAKNSPLPCPVCCQSTSLPFLCLTGTISTTSSSVASSQLIVEFAPFTDYQDEPTPKIRYSIGWKLS